MALQGHVDEDGIMHQSPASPHERNFVQLAYSGPDTQLAFLEGRQRSGLCLEDMRCNTVPLCWEDQKAALVA